MLDVLLHEKLSSPIKTSKRSACNVMIIEDDYVNYLMVEAVLKEIDIPCHRVNSLTDAALLDNSEHHFDIIIISESENDPQNGNLFYYLRNKHKAPVLLLKDREGGALDSHEDFKGIDGVILNYYDADYFKEIIDDLLSLY